MDDEDVAIVSNSVSYWIENIQDGHSFPYNRTKMSNNVSYWIKNEVRKQEQSELNMPLFKRSNIKMIV